MFKGNRTRESVLLKKEPLADARPGILQRPAKTNDDAGGRARGLKAAEPITSAAVDRETRKLARRPFLLPGRRRP
jgi:hypothetical protein